MKKLDNDNKIFMKMTNFIFLKASTDNIIGNKEALDYLHHTIDRLKKRISHFNLVLFDLK